MSCQAQPFCVHSLFGDLVHDTRGKEKCPDRKNIWKRKRKGEPIIQHRLKVNFWQKEIVVSDGNDALYPKKKKKMTANHFV